MTCARTTSRCSSPWTGLGWSARTGRATRGCSRLPAQRQLPNLVIASPKDEQELRSLLRTALAQDHPFALHYPRDAGFGLEPVTPSVLPIGQGEVLREGHDLLFVGSGRSWRGPLRRRIFWRPRAGPWASSMPGSRGRSTGNSILDQARGKRMLVTFEESVVVGGFGSGVLELVEEARLADPAYRDVAVRILGIPGEQFVDHGSVSDLRACCASTPRAWPPRSARRSPRRARRPVGRGRRSPRAERARDRPPCVSRAMRRALRWRGADLPVVLRGESRARPVLPGLRCGPAGHRRADRARSARSSPSSSRTWPDRPAIGEGLDPEALRRVQARYFDTLSAAIEAHGGRVEKYIGDAVMAVFGIPRLHEDDALRAVRSAAAMQQAVAALNDESRARLWASGSPSVSG